MESTIDMSGDISILDEIDEIFKCACIITLKPETHLLNQSFACIRTAYARAASTISSLVPWSRRRHTAPRMRTTSRRDASFFAHPGSFAGGQIAETSTAQ
jgi:hypothetical protein